MTDVLVESEARLSVAQRFRIAKTRSQRLLSKYDDSEPRDDHGRWSGGGGGDDAGPSTGARPMAMRMEDTSPAAFAKVEAAVAAIPAGHAAQIAHVPVVLAKTSDDFPSHAAAGGGSSTVGLFGWANNQPRIDIAEAIKFASTITDVAPQGKPSQTARTETLLPVRQPEQVTVHELAHAFDYVNGWKPSAHPGLNQGFADAVKQMTPAEVSNASYWIKGGPREMFAELYSVIHNPNKASEQTYFGGMTRERAEQVFAPAIAHVRQIKRFDGVVRRAPTTPGKTGWWVNGDGCLYALLGGMPYEVDVTGTPLADAQIAPGTYADDAALSAAAQAKKAKAYDPSEPRDDSGKWTSGGGSDSDAKPAGGGGKSKKPAKKEDFDKAKIKITSNEKDFIDKWNDAVGEDPAEFKAKFMGGLDGPMSIGGSGGRINIDGEIHGDAGQPLGTFTRNIDLDNKSAYSAYFKLNKSATKGDIGKKMLAGNVETYKNLGIEKLTVTANIDVGGYAWAKYGYVPTQSSWNELRGDLERKLTGSGKSSSSSSRSDNTMEADDWDQLSSDRQDDVRDEWMRSTRDEFVSSEEQNWRDSGQAKDDAKRELADDFKRYGDDIPEWATKALDGARAYMEGKDLPPIPYTNEQLYDAITLEYDSRNGDGEDDPDISFDDDLLKEPEGYDPAQGTLPGIEAVEPSDYLTKAMRDRIEKRLIAGFDEKAEDEAHRMDAPSYLADNVSEYQDEYWSSMRDRDRLQHAIDQGMADIEIEPDEDEEDEEPQHEMDLPKTEADPVLAAVRSSDPKSIWKVADSPQGKQLLLGTGWNGVLNLKDKAQMDRFDKYVGKAAHA